MKYFKNDTVSCCCEEELLPYISILCTLVKEHPFILEHVRGINQKAQDIFRKEGFQLYSTVENTTLLYHRGADRFFKMLHPLNFKKRIHAFLFNRAEQIYSLSEHLIAKGVLLPKIAAFGIFRKTRVPFFAMERVEGNSLYDLIVREKKQLPLQTYLNAIEEIAKLQKLGYWFGDAHLDHIFLKDGQVSGLIDIDSFRENRFFRHKNLAKDIACLNHPKLPLTDDDKNALLKYYIDLMKISKKEQFTRLVRHYTAKRWKSQKQ